MNALIGNLTQWWEGRTRRERWMVACMIVAMALFMAWLLIVRPLWSWRAAAAEDRLTASAELVEVRGALRGLASAPSPGAAPAGGIEPVARQTAEAAGLEVTTGMDASGQLGFQASSASSAALFGWLSDLTRNRGVAIARLSVTENADATLNAEGALIGSQG